MSENRLFSWDFSDGTLNDLMSWGYLVQPSIGKCRCENPPDTEGNAALRAVLPAAQSELHIILGYSFIRLPTIDYGQLLFCRVANPAQTAYPLVVNVQYRPEGTVWRVDYESVEGSKSVWSEPKDIPLDQELIIDVKIKGGTNGFITLNVNGETILHVEDAIPGLFGAVDTGIPWAAANCAVDVFSIDVYGVPAVNYLITGLLVNEAEEAVVGAGVTADGVGTTSLENGDFTLTVPAGIYTVRITAAGYETKTIENVDASTMNVDLGTIGLATVTAVYWPVRCATIFPYWTPYSSSSYDNLLSELKQEFGGLVDTVDVRLYWIASVEDRNNIVFYDANGQNSFEEVEAAIRKAHGQGFKVQLGIICGSNSVDTTIPFPSPTDWNLWHQNQKNMLVQFAQFAQENHVEYFIMGWEENFVDPRMNDGTWSAFWQEKLDAVRQVYSGKVGYEDNFPDEEPSISNLFKNPWYANLDFLAISNYVPLSKTRTPTLGDLLNGWTNNQTTGVDNYVQLYRDLREFYNRPVLLNIGYPSYDGCNMTPWRSAAGVPDHEEQALCWESFFISFRNSSLFGVTMEHYDKPYAAADATSSWRGKLAEQKIKEGLENVSAPIPPIDLPIVAAASLAIADAALVVWYILTLIT